jgi:hypothetical protein
MARQALQPVTLVALAATSLAWVNLPATAIPSRVKFENLRTTIANCLAMASREGFPYYDRQEAKPTCDLAKAALLSFEREANKNKQLACSSRIAMISFDIWMIQFLGGPRMETEMMGKMGQLERNCYNMDTRH